MHLFGGSWPSISGYNARVPFPQILLTLAFQFNLFVPCQVVYALSSGTTIDVTRNL